MCVVMDAGLVMLIVSVWFGVVVLILAVMRGSSERLHPSPPPPPSPTSVLEQRLLTALEESHRTEVENLLAIIGVEPRPDVAEQHRAELLAEIRRGIEDQQGPSPAVQEVQASVPLRQPWAFPISPDDLEPGEQWEDPTDLSAPLDQLPDAIAPEGPAEWGPAEPVAFPEPVPEGEYRPGAVGFAPGENPLSDIGIAPAWTQE